MIDIMYLGIYRPINRIRGKIRLLRSVIFIGGQFHFFQDLSYDEIDYNCDNANRAQMFSDGPAMLNIEGRYGREYDLPDQQVYVLFRLDSNGNIFVWAVAPRVLIANVMFDNDYGG